MENLYDNLYVPEEGRSTAVTKEDVLFIQSFLQREKYGMSRTLEIGMAYGFSTAAIISTTLKPHVAIDPNQLTEYNNIAKKNIEKLGLSHLLNHFEEKSYTALPRFVNNNERFDFIFIDGDHKFDYAFLDFFYADLLINQNKFILLHDYWMPAIKKLHQWINNNKKEYVEIGFTGSLLLLQKTKTEQRITWDDYKAF